MLKFAYTSKMYQISINFAKTVATIVEFRAVADLRSVATFNSINPPLLIKVLLHQFFFYTERFVDHKFG